MLRPYDCTVRTVRSCGRLLVRPGFHWQNQARPLHSNAHLFKILALIGIIFGIIPQRDILNMSVNFILITNWLRFRQDGTPINFFLVSSQKYAISLLISMIARLGEYLSCSLLFWS